MTVEENLCASLEARSFFPFVLLNFWCCGRRDRQHYAGGSGEGVICRIFSPIHEIKTKEKNCFYELALRN